MNECPGCKHFKDICGDIHKIAEIMEENLKKYDGKNGRKIVMKQKEYIKMIKQVYNRPQKGERNG